MRQMPKPVPESLRDLASDVGRDLGGERARDLVDGCLTNTWTTSMHQAPDGEVCVLTGDIPAMWLRDSTAQVRPYLLVARDDHRVGDALVGLSRRQSRCVLLDPYANAFNAGPTGAHGDDSDRPVPGAWVWERKYEVDSLAAHLTLAYAIWRATGRTDHLDGQFAAAARRVIETWRVEQAHDGSRYTFERTCDPLSPDSLQRQGRGGEVAPTGMTWSGFRPSDDRCDHGYLVPSNAMAAVSLYGLAEVASAVHDDELAADASALAAELAEGIRRYGLVEVDGAQVFAYEVDGLGNTLVADDANLPSLLSLPLTGWCAATDPVYLATREIVLSPRNPWFYAGRHAAGVGSPHTPAGYVWPLAIAAAGLTTPDQEHRAAALDLLASTTAGTGLMHESFDVDDPTRFTRAWFGWANAMFAELALDLTGRSVAACFPKAPALT